MANVAQAAVGASQRLLSLLKRHRPNVLDIAQARSGDENRDSTDAGPIDVACPDIGSHDIGASVAVQSSNRDRGRMLSCSVVEFWLEAAAPAVHQDRDTPSGVIDRAQIELAVAVKVRNRDFERRSAGPIAMAEPEAAAALIDQRGSERDDEAHLGR